LLIKYPLILLVLLYALPVQECTAYFSEHDLYSKRIEVQSGENGIVINFSAPVSDRRIKFEETFFLGMPFSDTRSWHMKITDYSCDADTARPAGPGPDLSSLVKFGKFEVLRDLNVVRVTIDPFSYYSGKTIFFTHIKIEIIFNRPVRAAAGPPDLFAPVYRCVANYRGAINYLSSGTPQPASGFQSESAPGTFSTLAPGKGADLVYIAPEDFISALEKPALRHTASGLRVRIVSAKEIYEQFSEGSKSPAAIKKFLSYAYREWEKPALSYAILVGDAVAEAGSGAAAPDYLPAYLKNGKGYGTGEPPLYNTTSGETVEDPFASENYYSTICGTDILPDIIVARLPVVTSGEIDAIYEKTAAYEKGGSWQKDFILAADDGFESYLDEAAVKAGPGYNFKKFYLKDFPLIDKPDNPKRKISPMCTEALVSALGGGAGFAHYEGHAGVGVWSHEAMFLYSDIDKLSNQDRYFILTNMTCLTGYFTRGDTPWDRCLAERFLTMTGKGACAVIAPAGKGNEEANSALAQNFYGSLPYFSDIGSLFTYSLIKTMAQNEAYSHIVEMYLLFGDPLLRINPDFRQ